MHETRREIPKRNYTRIKHTLRVEIRNITSRLECGVEHARKTKSEKRKTKNKQHENIHSRKQLNPREMGIATASNQRWALDESFWLCPLLGSKTRSRKEHCQYPTVQGRSSVQESQTKETRSHDCHPPAREIGSMWPDGLLDRRGIMTNPTRKSIEKEMNCPTISNTEKAIVL